MSDTEHNADASEMTEGAATSTTSEAAEVGAGQGEGDTLEASSVVGDNESGVDDESGFDDEPEAVDDAFAVAVSGAGEFDAAADESADLDEAAESIEGVAAPADDDEEFELEGHPGLSKAAPKVMGADHLAEVLESVLFVSDKPLTARALANVVGESSATVTEALEALVAQYAGRGIELVELATGYQFRSAARNAPFVQRIVGQKPVRLTRAQLETLSIVAYRQPVTRPELEDVRGVDCGAALKVLLERNLLRVLGRKEEPGRPLLYGTTAFFLEFFGLKGLRDLPTLREFSELTDESKALFQRRIGEPLAENELAKLTEESARQAETPVDPSEGLDLDDFMDGGPRPAAPPKAEPQDEDDEDDEDDEGLEDGDEVGLDATSAESDDDDEDDDEDDELESDDHPGVGG